MKRKQENIVRILGLEEIVGLCSDSVTDLGSVVNPGSETHKRLIVSMFDGDRANRMLTGLCD